MLSYDNRYKSPYSKWTPDRYKKMFSGWDKHADVEKGSEFSVGNKSKGKFTRWGAGVSPWLGGDILKTQAQLDAEEEEKNIAQQKSYDDLLSAIQAAGTSLLGGKSGSV